MTPKGADGRGREDAVCGECGHRKWQHTNGTGPCWVGVGTTAIDGSLSVELCPCMGFREPAPAKGENLTQAASGSRPDFSEAETRLPDRSAASSLAEQTGGLRGGEGNSAPSASSQPRRAVGQSDQPVTHLSDAELARIEAQHPPCDLTIRAFCSNGYNHDPNAGDVSHCRCGYEPWPCDTIKLVAALRSAYRRIEELKRQ